MPGLGHSRAGLQAAVIAQKQKNERQKQAMAARARARTARSAPARTMGTPHEDSRVKITQRHGLHKLWSRVLLRRVIARAAPLRERNGRRAGMPKIRGRLAQLRRRSLHPLKRSTAQRLCPPLAHCQPRWTAAAKANPMERRTSRRRRWMPKRLRHQTPPVHCEIT